MAFYIKSIRMHVLIPYGVCVGHWYLITFRIKFQKLQHIMSPAANEIVLDETHQTLFNFSNSYIFTTEHQVNVIHKAVTEHHITKSTPNAHYKSRHCYSRISNLCTICQPARYTLSSAPGGVGWEKYVNPVTVTRY